jgi:hypothetical protein
VTAGGLEPAAPACLLEPMRVEFYAVIGEHRPGSIRRIRWGCHRRRIGSRVVFEHLIAVLHRPPTQVIPLLPVALSDSLDRMTHAGIVAEGALTLADADRPGRRSGPLD